MTNPVLERIAALAPLAEAGDDEALAEAIRLKREGRYSIKAKLPKAAKKARKAKATTPETASVEPPVSP